MRCSIEVLAVEMVVDAFTLFAAQVSQSIDLEHMSVCQKIVCLQVEERLPSLGKCLLETDES